jgi:hypothetical protein
LLGDNESTPLDVFSLPIFGQAFKIPGYQNPTWLKKAFEYSAFKPQPFPLKARGERYVAGSVCGATNIFQMTSEAS